MNTVLLVLLILAMAGVLYVLVRGVIAMLMRNTLVAAHRRAGLNDPEGL